MTTCGLRNYSSGRRRVTGTQPRPIQESTPSMEHIPVTMVREDLCGLRSHPLPEGYRLRRFCPGDERLWAEIETQAGEFDDPAYAEDRFNREFGASLDEMRDRCFILETADGHGIGTATAWYNGAFRRPDTDALLGDCGRIHWVGIRPAFQGRGLSKPLVSVALSRLSESHTKAYLTTQTTSWIAVKVYIDLGFVPLLPTPRWEEAWRLIAETTRCPQLARFL